LVWASVPGRNTHAAQKGQAAPSSANKSNAQTPDVMSKKMKEREGFSKKSFAELGPI